MENEFSKIQHRIIRGEKRKKKGTGENPEEKKNIVFQIPFVIILVIILKASLRSYFIFFKCFRKKSFKQENWKKYKAYPLMLYIMT